jgi:hypothetical protein
MYHVEIRGGGQVVREFNRTEQRLWLEVLEPLMTDREFEIEGHEFVPRQTRLTVYEGPELRPDQLGMGRGWQNVERTATDVTERVLARAREHVAGAPGGLAPSTAETPVGAAGVVSPTGAGASVTGAVSADLLRERLIGRLSAGPIAGDELLRIAAELLPNADEQQRTAVAAQAVWALLERDVAQLTPSDR